MRIERRQILYIALILINAAVPFISPPAIISGVSSFIHFYLIPGLAFVMLFGDPHRHVLDNLLMPLLLSPVMVTLSVIGFDLLGLPFGTAVELSLGLFSLVLLVLVLRGTGLRPTGVTAHPGLRGWWIIATPVAFAATVAAAYAVNTYLLSHSDSWTHACYVSEILDRGLPPMEPCLPDVPLRYMWFYHLFISSFIRISGIDLFWAMGLFNISAAFCFPLLVARITALISDRAEHVALVPLFAIAGLESPLWITWPLNLLRALFGEVRDADEIARIFGNVHLNSPRVIHSLRSQWTWMVNLIDKFLTITAFGFALELFLLAVMVVLTFPRERGSRVRSMVFLIAILVGTLTFHLVTGAALVLTLLIMISLYALYERLRNHRSIPFEIRVLVPASAIIASLMVIPYVRSVLSSSSGQGSWRNTINFNTISLFTIIAPLIILLPFARSALRRAIAVAGEKYKMLGAWILALSFACILIDLPGVNESKLIFPLFALLLIIIAPELIDRMLHGKAKWMTAALVAILFLVPPIMTIRGFILARPVGEEYVRRNSIDDEDRILFAWIDRNTPPDAVIIERNDYRLMPVFAHRRNFFPNQHIIATVGYSSEKIERYREIRNRIFSSHRMTAGDIAYLAGTRLPFYVVVWREDLATEPALKSKLEEQSAFFRKVFEHPRATIYRVETESGRPTR